MATMNEVRWWNTVALEQLEASLTTRLRLLDRVNTTVTDVGKLPGWEGEAATAAHQSFNSAVNLFTDHAAPLGAVRTMSGQARTSIVALKRLLSQLELDCNKQQLMLHDDGRINPTPTAKASAGDIAALTARATAILKKAEDIQLDMADVLRRAVDGKIGDGGATTVTAAADTGSKSGSLTAPAPPVGNPRLGRAWWDSLTPEEQQQVLRTHPEWPGSTDGVPTVARDQGNRTVLAGLTQTAQAQLDANTRQHPEWAAGKVPTMVHNDSVTMGKYLAWMADRDRLIKEVSGYRAVQEALGKPGLPKYLMHVDNQGRAAIALNNPDKANNIATFVPGTTAGTDDLPAEMDRMERIADSARRASPDSATAVVAWYDYSAPQALLTDAPRTRFAEDGAPRLNQFQEGLRAAHDGPRSYNTVIGHSYGSTVIGYSASHGRTLDADNLIFAGSPGVGVQHASDLRLTGLDPKLNGGHVYATAMPQDFVPRTEGHGPSPSGRPMPWQVANLPFPIPIPNPAAIPLRPSFGATEFESTGPLNPFDAHSAYWDYNVGLNTQGRIITGQGA